jgi:preprotein translocase subunit SecF
VGRRRWGYALSVLIILPGLAALVAQGVAGRGALNWGIDFTGGNFFQLALQRPFTVGEVRAVVDRFATGQSIIQKSGQEVLIRTRPLEPGRRQALLAALRERFGEVTILREDEVGPKIGRELRTVAIVGVAVGLALQVLYISLRFKSLRYAVAADIALLHDLLVVVGVFALTRKEVNSSFVAVLLTVVGYSINDTVVLFDRIRENLAQRTREPFDRLVNRSILEALARSLNTALTTILAIAAVYVFGGSTIRDFAFGLMIGILTGAYSSIFNASPILVDWHLWSERRHRAAAVPVASTPALAGRPRARKG